ncbi:hypothetical protein Aduo_017852 [Ancylostoma duodenale]
MQLVTASLLSLLALTHLACAADKPLIIENGAVCENKATGFFVVDNTILGTTDSIVYKDTPEEDCLNTCSTNRDRYGRSILCASFVYDHVSFTCTIFKEKAKPEGKADAVQAVGKRYFEKVCLGDAVPMECADSQFIRADDSVLIGFARNVTLVETMEQCVEQCVKEQDCKSAMYFYEEGECITNTESALSKPSSFAKEENEKVVYFQNGCLTKLQSQETTTTSTEPSTTTESAEKFEESDAAPEKEHPDLTTAQPSEDTNSEKEAETEAKSKEERELGEEVTEPATEPTTTSAESTTSSEISSVPPTSVISEKTSDEEEGDETTSAESTSTTTTTESLGATESERGEKLDEEDEDYGGEDENGEVETVTSSDRSSMEKLDKKGEKASYIKFKKHPKNFASKTAKISDNKHVEVKKEKAPKEDIPTGETPADETVASNGSSLEEETGESLVTDEGGEPVEGQTSPLDKKKHLSIKRVLESAEKEDSEEYPTYFSEWSDWTPCTKGGERQIRRRKCLDLRRCLGALMQVRNCPAVLPEAVQSGPIESVRSVIEVPRIPEYDDADGNQFDARSSPVVQQSSETVWSPWLGVCQHFASGQPCNNGEMIGFESRECIAKEPSLCEGPFFRYCTLPC